MNLDFSDEQTLLRETVRSLCADLLDSQRLHVPWSVTRAATAGACGMRSARPA